MKIIAVIHIILKENLSRLEEQCKIAFENGCYGIFLCPAENNITPDNINSIYYNIRKLYPNKFIGINYMNNIENFIHIIPDNISAIWTDKGIGNYDSMEMINKINEIKNKKKFLYFGGFFHKGNNNNISKMKINKKIKKANLSLDVITTTGESTGIPIDLEILKHIKELSNKPIALASGININNINNYNNIIEYAIIGTGIEKDCDDINIINFYKEAMLPDPVNVGYLDKNKIKKIINII